MDCIFCKIANGEIPTDKIYEDENVIAFLDIKPVNPGHVLIVPKEHTLNLLTISDDLAQKVVLAAKKIAKAMTAGLGTESFNLAQNNGPDSEPEVMHFHWHLIPRHKNDGLSPWGRKEYTPGEKEEIINKIKSNL